MKPIDVELNAAGLKVFEAMAGNRLLLLPDDPHFTVVAATGDYCRFCKKTQAELVGRPWLETGCTTGDSTGGTQELSLQSLKQVLETKESHQVSLSSMHAYLLKEQSSDKNFSVVNKPVLNESGDIIFIIHSVEEISEPGWPGGNFGSTGIRKAYDLFMNAPVIIGILSGDDYIIELANEGLLEVWDKSVDVIGKSLMVAVPELRDQGFLPLLEEVRKTGEPFYAYEFPITLHRQGKNEVLYFDFVYKPIYDNDSQEKASGIISVGHNVTAQVLAKQKVQESEAKYRRLFETMDQGFCVMEILFDDTNKPVDYVFLEINPVFEKQTGLKDAVGKTALQLVPNLESTWLTLYGNVALTGEPKRFVEGSKAMGRWFEVFAFKIGDESSRQVAVLFTDITQRKNSEEALRQSEQNLRNTILQAPFAMGILRGHDFVVEIANNKMFELWGRGKEEVLGKSIFEALPEVRNQGYEELLTKVFTTGKTFSALGIPVTLPRNNTVETVYIDLLYEAFREADGSISGIVAVAIDVTQQVLAKQKIELAVAERTQELAQANEALMRSNLELARSNQNLEQFAYAASHDLKEPLRKIQIFSDRLKTRLQSSLTDEAKTYFDRIQLATHRMKTLVEDLLTYSYVSRGVETREMVNLNETVRQVLVDLELEIEQRKASIVIDALPTIRGHRRQLQQLFQNLISNGIKFKKPAELPNVDIRCTITGYDQPTPIDLQKRSQLFYLIEVKDNGIGFNPEDAERIFTVFTRLHRIPEQAGTGIGLSIVRKVVENHGGYVWAESKPDVGANFKIMFPVE